MRFRPKHVAVKAWIRRDKFWKIYKSRDIQEKSQDASITNFPVLTAQDMNWDYIYAYVLEWIEKKCKARGDIVVKKQDNEYLCETKSCFRFNTILDALYKDFKEIFIARLVKAAPVKEPVPQQQEALQQDQQVDVQPAAPHAALQQEDVDPLAVPQQEQVAVPLQDRSAAPVRKGKKQAPDLEARVDARVEEELQPKPALKRKEKGKDS
ncbi:hypothetical protein [Borrelia sp. RT5S]|uniref:hypothetical protein n=1 Tax=Borrelia sp. RT5S TaxID=2898581 RepID=UPI001E38194A|nr:hypothetical protein [Borrelia sp. RT5S]UGQ16702.1 hypothetical protein LSO06_05125 [Borrelia sp. RT5S]